MAEAGYVIIEHEDGRRYGVPAKDPRATGKEPGWTVEGPETDATFVATGIPKPKRVRNRPKAKAAAAIAEPHVGGDASDPDVHADIGGEG